ncbi:MAG: 3-keto-disaccharide hydrolase [Thermoguttaceae bacterium]
MLRKTELFWTILLACCTACAAQEIIDPDVAKENPDFLVQGEYLGEGILLDGARDKVGAQVVALGDGRFSATVFKGGLPGEGWLRDDPSFAMEGKTEDGATKLAGRNLSATIQDGTMVVTDPEGAERIRLTRTERKSPTLGAEPPEGATVLYDGSDADHWAGGQITDLKTLHAGTSLKEPLGPNGRKLHIEFRTSWMPQARGQGRSNSGVYVDGRYEVQVLDSFGLEGKHNECGGIYTMRDPNVNMCLPPLTWQTYDIDFTPAKYDEKGVKTANARITVRHNGVVIHDDFELPGATPGGRPEAPGPDRLLLQGHGNKVQYKNLWAVEK